MLLAPIPSNPFELRLYLEEPLLFLLAQDWIGTERAEWWPLVRNGRHRVILDQGAYEHGSPVPMEDYLQVIRGMQPWMSIAPDWLDAPSQKTRMAWTPFCALLREMRPSGKAMYVPQAKQGQREALVDEF